MNPNTETWFVEQLVSAIDQRRVRKPRCQRKKRWQLFPSTTSKCSNYQDYIKFLYTTCHTIEVISMAKKILDHQEIYMNIDGNNRINAIHYFYHHPLEILGEIDTQEKKVKLFENLIAKGGKKMKEFLEKISYPDFIDQKNLGNYILENGPNEIKDLWRSFSSTDIQLYEKELDIAQKLLKVNGNRRFDQTVKINLVIFTNVDDTELSNIFASINKNNNPLTKSDILAATLITAIDFEIEDKVLKQCLLRELEEYYEEKSEGEILDGFLIQDEGSFNMNGNEFLIAYQNYSANKYKFIKHFDGKNNDFMHKLFDFSTVFFSLESKSFISKNVNYFIEKINRSFEIINNILTKIFTQSIEQFKKQIFTFCKNDIFILLIMTTILSEQENVEKILKKVLYFHFFIESLENDEKSYMRAFDDLYSDGAGFIIQVKLQNFCKDPTEFGKKITEGKMKEVIDLLLKSYNKPVISGEKKRIKVDMGKRLLLSIYYNNKVPTEFTRRSQHIDHIIPYSSKYIGELDINRLGNMMIMDGEMNSGRGNRSISYYYETNPELMKTLNYPSIEEYDHVVEQDGRNTEIIDNDYYDGYATRLENTYRDFGIKYIFRM